jgi:hypothetical protein
MPHAEAPRAAPACAERDPRIEQASRPLDPADSTLEALAPRALDDLEPMIIGGAVRALRRRAERQADIARAAGERAGEGVIALRLAAALGGLADEIEADTR